MSEPSTTRRWLGRLTTLACCAGGLGGIVSAVKPLLSAGTVASVPAWVLAVILLLVLVALLGAVALIALYTCWPSQSAHRKELLEALLLDRTTS